MTLLAATTLLTNAHDVASALASGDFKRPFAVEGMLLNSRDEHSIQTLVLSDLSGCVGLYDWSKNRNLPLNGGDKVFATGRVSSNRFGLAVAICSDLRVLSHGTPPPPKDVTAEEIYDGTCDYMIVRTKGIVREAFVDEIDPDWVYCSLSVGALSVYISAKSREIPLRELARLTDAEVSVLGICEPSTACLRQKLGRVITISSMSAFTILRNPPSDPFSAPPIDSPVPMDPMRLSALGKRRMSGTVIALAADGMALVQDRDGIVHNVSFSGGELPTCGHAVDIVGMPETDLYRINFSNAIWRESDSRILPAAEPADTAIGKIISSHPSGVAKIDPRYHGRAIRLTGSVIDLPRVKSGLDVCTLKCGDFAIPVDVRAKRGILTELSIGCTVAASGICIVDTETWRTYSAFPHAKGIRLVVRPSDDVSILSRPSWWTPQRLMVVVGILLLILVAIFIWNRILQRIINRKSRQVLKEQVAQIKAALRVDERTHLAVELHDSLSQNLSGVACQIAATKGTLPDGADETARYLAAAERMLLSCRTELRRCLWDLRGDTLEEADFTEAIRKTLAPVAIGVEPIIRFNVPRSQLSDTTAHAILCIVRELVTNAIRHGKAKTIQIAGEFHDGSLSFSVRDDGRGFDPTNCNGPAEGHFGLEGIRERIKRLDGTFSLSSESGKGTRAEVTLVSLPENGKDAEA